MRLLDRMRWYRGIILAVLMLAATVHACN